MNDFIQKFLLSLYFTIESFFAPPPIAHFPFNDPLIDDLWKKGPYYFGDFCECSRHFRNSKKKNMDRFVRMNCHLSMNSFYKTKMRNVKWVIVH